MDKGQARAPRRAEYPERVKEPTRPSTSRFLLFSDRVPLKRILKGGPFMPKVFGMHMIALRHGVKPEDFERFMVEKVHPSLQGPPGVCSYLLKGDRGDREGRYLWMIEFPSVEARDQLFPAPGPQPKQAQQSTTEVDKLFEEWEQYATPVDTISTDYVVVEK